MLRGLAPGLAAGLLGCEELPPACDCIDDDPRKGAEVSAPRCGESLCSEVVLDLDFEISNPDAAICALTALRDRAPGIVTWGHYDGDIEDHGYVLIFGNGTAVHRSWGWQGTVFEASDASFGKLDPPEVFDACLTEPDDLTRFDCLRNGLASTSAGCDDGWRDDDFE